jgi:iron(III) transport system substrate-binding protein
MTSGGKMVDAVGKGEAKLGYFVSAITVLPKLETYPDLGWSYMADGQPILLRNMAITQKSASPNSARLMIDFILSQEGQYALALGGLTPYRSDISGISSIHLDQISSEVGNDNLIMFSFDARLLVEENRTKFIDKWKAAVHKEAAAAPTPTP